MYSKIILSVVFLILLSARFFPQEENNQGSDTTQVWNWEDLKYEDANTHIDKKYTLSFIYGLSKISLMDLNSGFTKPLMLEFKLGRSAEYPVAEKRILKYYYTNLFLSYISTKVPDYIPSKLFNNFKPDGLKSALWRFGIEWRSGYGYSLGYSSLILFNSGSLDWSRLNLKDFPANQQYKKQLERFNKAFRFGTSADGGVRLKLTPFAALEASYQKSVIFERHLFWKWAGSGLIYLTGIAIVNSFARAISTSSPYMVPIVSFALKSAFSYEMYRLLHKKMNWPFKTAPPLEYDQFKLGLTIVF